MTRFNLAHQTYRGHSSAQADQVMVVPHPPFTWVIMSSQAEVALPANLADPATTPAAVLAALGPHASLCLRLHDTALTLEAATQPGLWHYVRLSDATLTPLGPTVAQPISFQRGDAYVALSPGARHLTDSPTVARFVHLRDYFTASTLARAVLAHLEDVTRTDDFPVDVTVLVVETR